MKTIVRGFLAGFGFALGASVAGTLIGYAIGRIGEAGLKQLLSSPSEQPSPQPGGTGSSADDLPVQGACNATDPVECPSYRGMDVDARNCLAAWCPTNYSSIPDKSDYVVPTTGFLGAIRDVVNPTGGWSEPEEKVHSVHTDTCPCPQWLKDEAFEAGGK